MIASRDVLAHELIGLDVLVTAASNPSHRGISGRIIDETKHMFVLETTRGVKRFPNSTAYSGCAFRTTGLLRLMDRS